MAKQSGQITILVLLLSMLALVGGMSVASRSLSDLRQVSYVDFGTKALAAAEAGLQYAFSDSQNWVTDCSTAKTVPVSLTGIQTQAQNGVTYKVCNVAKNSITVPNVQKDDVVQIDLTSANPNLNAFDISWRSGASIEIEVVDKDNGGNYYLRRYGYNPYNQSRDNGFAQGLPGSSCIVSGRPASICDNSFGGVNDSCTGFGEFSYRYKLADGATWATAQLVRIKPLYQASDLLLCAQTSGASQTGFGLQYYQVTAKAQALDGSTKKIQADYYPAALPAVFDNVLYSGGNINK